jgi:hypothetical protein
VIESLSPAVAGKYFQQLICKEGLVVPRLLGNNLTTPLTAYRLASDFCILIRIHSP